MKRMILFLLSLVLAFSLAIPAFASTDTDSDLDTDTETEVTIDDPDSYLLENDLPESEGFAEIQDAISTYSSSSVALVFKKLSSTTTKAQAYAARPGATYVKSTIKLQLKTSSGYSTVTNGTATKAVYDDSINHVCSFTVASKKTYRIKVAIKYKENGAYYTDTYYKALDSNGY